VAMSNMVGSAAARLLVHFARPPPRVCLTRAPSLVVEVTEFSPVLFSGRY
jgi:hypothetical protein